MSAHPPNRLFQVVGIDPGQDGGAVVLDQMGNGALRAVRWRKGPNGYTVRTLGAPTTNLPSLAAVGLHLSKLAGPYSCWLAVEGLFVPKADLSKLQTKKQRSVYGGRVARVLRLAESVGYLAGPLMDRAVRVERPQAGAWRHQVLGIPPFSPSDFAEARAIEALTKAKPPLVRGLGELATDPHVAEAACIARYAWTVQVGEAKLRGGG